jgi:hypothetical protein
MTHYAWALWLAAPALATMLVAVWTWWRGRATKPPSAAEAITAHRAYLAALANQAVGAGAEGAGPHSR